MNVNIFPKIESRLIIIATVRLYTKEIKNSNNGGLPCKHFYLENILNNLFSILVLTNYELNYNVATDQIIRKTILNYVLKVYAPCIAFSMPFKYLSYLCFIQYFIYRFIMSDYFSSEPMDIEGEAACDVGPQLVTVEGEQGAGVDFKRIFSHLEADFLLLSDDGEPTDDLNVGFPEEESRGSIPSEILFSTWVKAFWTSCWYDFPALMGGVKRMRSTNAGPRPTK